MHTSLSISVVIPVYNERNTIEEILRRVGHSPVANQLRQVIVVDDASSDGTREFLAGLAQPTSQKSNRLSVIRLSVRPGDYRRIKFVTLNAGSRQQTPIRVAELVDFSLNYASHRLGELSLNLRN